MIGDPDTKKAPSWGFNHLNLCETLNFRRFIFVLRPLFFRGKRFIPEKKAAISGSADTQSVPKWDRVRSLVRRERLGNLNNPYTLSAHLCDVDIDNNSDSGGISNTSSPPLTFRSTVRDQLVFRLDEPRNEGVLLLSDRCLRSVRSSVP